MNNIIISDTSCLIALNRIGHLNILQKIFTVIYVTQTIAAEFEEQLPSWILIKAVHNVDLVARLEIILDPGEASAISLALETENSILIIDEKKGRRIAQDFNVSIIGTLKVLLIAKNKGVIIAVKPILEQLQKHSFRFNNTVVLEVLKLAGEV